jgi:hypothetical protein
MTAINHLRARISDAFQARLAPFAAHVNKNLVRPTFICFKLSERCNSKCVHCDIWKNQHEAPLTTEQWTRTLDDIRRWVGPAHVVFTGGEVFLRRDSLCIITRAAKIGLICEVLTNGLLTEREHCEELVRWGVDQVTISLDGVTPDTHFAVRRVPGMHEKILRTIDDLDDCRRRYRAPTKILLKMVVMKPNLHELVAMADWVKDRGQASVRFQPIEQTYAQAEDLDWYKTSDLWIDDLPALTTAVHRLIARKQAGYPIRNSEVNLRSMIEYFSHPDRDMRKVQSHDDQRTEMCLSGVSSLVISSNGDVRWCHQMAPAGNVKTQLPRSIWESRAECWKRPCPWYP